MYFTFEVAAAMKVGVGAVEGAMYVAGEEAYREVRHAFAVLLALAAKELEYAR